MDVKVVSITMAVNNYRYRLKKKKLTIQIWLAELQKHSDHFITSLSVQSLVSTLCCKYFSLLSSKHTKTPLHATLKNAFMLAI